MNTFICHPERFAPHPAILLFMDAPGIREELRDMARRLGTVGYYVMLPNLYYRSHVEELGSVVGEANIATRQKALQLMTTINIPMVMQDVDALLAFAARDLADLQQRLAELLNPAGTAAGICRGDAGSSRTANGSAAQTAGRNASTATAAGQDLLDLAARWVQGEAVDWNLFIDGHPPRRVSLP